MIHACACFKEVQEAGRVAAARGARRGGATFAGGGGARPTPGDDLAPIRSIDAPRTIAPDARPRRARHGRAPYASNIDFCEARPGDPVCDLTTGRCMPLRKRRRLHQDNPRQTPTCVIHQALRPLRRRRRLRGQPAIRVCDASTGRCGLRGNCDCAAVPARPRSATPPPNGASAAPPSADCAGAAPAARSTTLSGACVRCTSTSTAAATAATDA